MLARFETEEALLPQAGEQLAAEIEAGKRIFVECAHAKQAAYYQNKLAAYDGPKLHIYVNGRA